MNKQKIKEVLGLPNDAKVKGIIYRRVKRNSDKKYPAVVYEHEGKQHIKHLNRKLREELGLEVSNRVSNQLDTVSNSHVSNSVSNHGEVSNQVSNQYLTEVSNRFLKSLIEGNHKEVAKTLGQLSKEERIEAIKTLCDGFLYLYEQNKEEFREEIESVKMLLELSLSIIQEELLNKSGSGSNLEL